MPDSREPPFLRVRGLVQRFGELTVLDGLDLDVRRGEKLALIGPSGSGKSTLLRVLMGLEGVAAGTVEVDGVEIARRAERPPRPERERRAATRRKLGMVFQHFHLFPHLSALRNVAEAPEHVLGLPRQQARERALALLEQVGLGEKAEAWPTQLSGGQKQRVAIARALAMEPEIMLFDEVTSALDPELVGEVLAVLRQLARETRMTMLVVTHQMRFAGDVADRVVFLDGGKVVESAPPAEIFSNPRHERTRRFLHRILEA